MALAQKVNNLFIEVAEAAANLKVSRQALYEAALKGKIQYTRIGRGFFLLRSSLKKYQINRPKQDAAKSSKPAKPAKPAARARRK